VAFRINIEASIPLAGWVVARNFPWTAGKLFLLVLLFLCTLLVIVGALLTGVLVEAGEIRGNSQLLAMGIRNYLRSERYAGVFRKI
jgi:hypothetical protein